MKALYTLGAALAATFALACSTTESGLSPIDAAFVSQQPGQSTQQDFEELCRAMEGRWIGDVTFITDWPGEGKRGEVVTGHTVIRRIADGNALFGTYFGGEGNNTWIATYDAASSQIVEFAVTSSGGVFRNTYYKQDGKWIFKSSGTFADGTPVLGNYQLDISNGGDTHHWTGSGTVGGEATDPLDDVWRRVSKPSGL